MTVLKAALFAISALITATAYTAQEPVGSPLFDQRLRFVDYNPDDVTTLNVFAGFIMQIRFAPDENVIEAYTGLDDKAYQITRATNSIVLRPKVQAPPTNLFVQTDQRTYFFDLVQSAPKALTDTTAHLDAKQTYRVQIRYPTLAFSEIQKQAENKKNAQSAELAKAIKIATAVKAKLSYEGDTALRPIEAEAREGFTYLKYPPDGEIPAAYIEASDGSETIATKHMQGDSTLVIHFAGRKIILRRGKAVGAVFNESYMGKAP